MAKTGFWLQGAKGKFAGAALQKTAYGSTMMREIVKPKNPQTQRQMYQRAILATVIRMYAAGNAIFDHSFEGVQAGAKSQSKFVSLNTKALRESIKEGDTAYVCAPGIMAAVPNDFQISAGTLAETYINRMVLPEAEAGETVKSYCQRNNLVEDDLYTICGLYVTDNTLYTLPGHSGDDVKVSQSQFFWIRLRVRNTDSIEQVANMSQFFEIDAYSLSFGSIKELDAITVGTDRGTNLKIDSFVDGRDFKGLYGVIRSREDSGLRSTSFMWHDDNSHGWGLDAKYLLDAWMPSAGNGLGEPSKILNGADSVPQDAYSITNAYYMAGGDERQINMSQPETYISWTPSSFNFRGQNLDKMHLTLKVGDTAAVEPTISADKTSARFTNLSQSAERWQLLTNGNPWLTFILEGE